CFTMQIRCKTMRPTGYLVTDFQMLNSADLQSAETLFKALAASIDADLQLHTRHQKTGTLKPVPTSISECSSRRRCWAESLPGWPGDWTRWTETESLAVVATKAANGPRAGKFVGA